MIVHVYDVPGNPAEARLDSRLGGMPVGSIHPWAGLPEHSGAYDHHFLQRQSFKHLVRSSKQDERLTRVTNVYRQTPCPNMFSLEIRSALRSVQEWYEKTDDNRDKPEFQPWDGLLQGTQNPIAIPQVRPVVVQRFRKVEMKISALMELAAKVGRTNKQAPWMHYKLANTWLFEGLHARMIYGTPLGDNTGEYVKGWFELTLFFEADVERQHEYWRVNIGKQGDENVGLPPFWKRNIKRRDLHNRKLLFPELDEDFSELVPMNEKACEAPEPEGIP